MKSDTDLVKLHLTLLGDTRIRVGWNPDAELRFRSKSAEQLLVLLAIRMGRTQPKADLAQMLWPESDGDHQAQNLRKAISDVRQVIEPDHREPTILLGSSHQIWLEASRCSVDAQQFRILTDEGLSADNGVDSLRQAVALYKGALLPSNELPWVIVLRMELEERFAQSVERLINYLLELEAYDEALRIGRQAITAAPLREDLHLALVRAYYSAGLRSQAVSQFQELESILDSEWGEMPSPHSIETFERLSESAPKVESPTPKNAVHANRESSSGAVPYGSSFYIDRECDRQFRLALSQNAGTILVHGPRQVGKTSLLSHCLLTNRERSPRFVVTDFQVLSRSQLQSPRMLYQTLAHGFALQAGAAPPDPNSWNEWIGPNSNLDSAIQAILAEVDTPVTWAMDEADRLFGTDYADDFFGLIRGWHNRRAMEPHGPFRHLSIAISYATEAHLFIRDINQSPFNVGVRIPVSDFNLDEIRELGLRYGVRLSKEEVEWVARISGGQPFLTRRAFDLIVHDGVTLADLERTSADEDGPFADHLEHLRRTTARDEQTVQELKRFLLGQSFLDPSTSLRLVAGGMLKRSGNGQMDFRVPCYRPYLSRFFGQGQV